MFCALLPETASLERIGGKAVGASRVLALGVEVPRTIVLESGALRAFLEANALWTRVVETTNTFPNLAGAAAEAAHRELVDTVHAGMVPASLAAELRAALEDLLSTAPCGRALRSSAVYEDSVAASFAGVFESWVGLTDRKKATSVASRMGCGCGSTPGAGASSWCHLPGLESIPSH